MVKKGLLLLFWGWYLFSVIIFAPLLLSYFFEDNSILSELLALLLSIGFPTLILALKRNKSGPMLFNVRFELKTSFGWRDALMILLGTISLFGALSYLQNTILLAEVYFTRDYSSVLVYPKVNAISFLTAVLTYAVAPALFEEILFRGIFTDAFALDKKWIRILIPVLSFAAMHSSGMGIISAALVGLFSLCCYDRFGSLICCILLHFLYNLLGLVTTNIVSLPFSALAVLNDYANFEQIKASIMISIGITGLCFLFFLMCFLKIRNNKDKSSDEPVQAVSSKWNIAINALFIIMAVGTAILNS